MLWVHVSPAGAPERRLGACPRDVPRAPIDGPPSPDEARAMDTGSPLALSATTRLAWVAAVCGLLWLAVWWALA